jgi:hypothetical protein
MYLMNVRQWSLVAIIAAYVFEDILLYEFISFIIMKIPALLIFKSILSSILADRSMQEKIRNVMGGCL